MKKTNVCRPKIFLLIVFIIISGLLFAKDLKYAPGGMIVKFSSELNDKTILKKIDGRETIITNVTSIDSINNKYKLKKAKKNV